jgi:DNA-directed RNA polymerase specialized sigma subunit
VRRLTDAQRQLAAGHHKLIYWIARRGLEPGAASDPEDESTATLALVRAAAHWHLGMPGAFSAYAVTTMARALARARFRHASRRVQSLRKRDEPIDSHDDFPAIYAMRCARFERDGGA